MSATRLPTSSSGTARRALAFGRRFDSLESVGKPLLENDGRAFIGCDATLFALHHQPLSEPCRFAFKCRFLRFPLITLALELFLHRSNLRAIARKERPFCAFTSFVSAHFACSCLFFRRENPNPMTRATFEKRPF